MWEDHRLFLFHMVFMNRNSEVISVDIRQVMEVFSVISSCHNASSQQGQFSCVNSMVGLLWAQTHEHPQASVICIDV